MAFSRSSYAIARAVSARLLPRHSIAARPGCMSSISHIRRSFSSEAEPNAEMDEFGQKAIALLQEVIDRTQEKINFLSAPTVHKMDNYYSLEDDSFDLPSPGPRCFTPPPAVDVPVLTSVLSHLDKLMKEGSKKANEVKEEEKKKTESMEEIKKVTSVEVKTQITTEKVDEKSDESDEGLPSSDCDSSSEDDKDAEKASVIEKEKTPEKIIVRDKTPENVTVKERTPEKITVKEK